MKYFRLVWAGLWRRKARTSLTMLSIVFAFLLYGLLQGINQGFNAAIDDLDVDRLYVTSSTSLAEPLPQSYFEQIKAVEGVAAVSHWTFFGGYFQEARNAVPAFATDPRALFQVYKELRINPEYLDAMDSTRTGALVSETLVRQYGWKIGDRVPLGTSIWTLKSGGSTWEFDIVGTFDASAYGMGFPSFYFNHSYFREASARGGATVNMYLVRVDDPRKAMQIAGAIDARFANSSAETRSQTESALAQVQLKQLGDVNFIVNAIVGAVLFTLLFLTANTMMHSVRERIPEFAILKSLGFSDGKVLTLVLMEGLLLCLLAAAAGLSLADSIFASPPLQAIFGQIPMPTAVLVNGTVIAVMLALISALPPAWIAKRLSVVEALALR